MRVPSLLVAAMLCGCPPPERVEDAGADAGTMPTPCAAAADCRGAGLWAACRAGLCEEDVPCGDDLECALGERCVRGQCRFTGCTKDSECATGKCLTASYSCVECGASTDCPAERPVCDRGTNLCVQCRSDADCALPGPAHCSAAGACVACTESRHCPNGLSCSSGNLCVGVALGGACPTGTACAPGLACVNVGASPVCLKSCSLYAPAACATGQLCHKLTYQGSSALVFEGEGPIGVCFAPSQGLRGLREPCTRSAGTSNCQPNLLCMPESASLSLCRGFCNPLASGTCAAGDRCVGFVGDSTGRRYGVCLPDTGFGAQCSRDPACRAGLSCQAWDDPSADSDVTPICQYNVGSRPALAPCAPVALADGGVIPASRTCQSGVCARDPLFAGAAPYFCLGVCRTDQDCVAGGRRGVCDGTFDVVTPLETPGTVQGCRPGCETQEDCAAYDAGVSCRMRVDSTLTTATYTSTCSPSPGLLRAGAPCLLSSECRSSFCAIEDARGVRRSGVCLEPCRAGEACPDGVLPQACAPTVLLLSRGPDGLAGSADDLFGRPRLCAGAGCTVDADCQADGGLAHCVPDVAGGTGAAELRCRMPAPGTLEGGASCTSDPDCRSGVCAELGGGRARVCFQACAAGSSCPGMTSCRRGGVTVTIAGSPVPFDACAP